ncbi:hypothetical protein P9112_005839 [Eukaryota sp. TZLM1-RC]
MLHRGALNVNDSGVYAVLGDGTVLSLPSLNVPPEADPPPLYNEDYLEGSVVTAPDCYVMEESDLYRTFAAHSDLFKSSLTLISESFQIRSDPCIYSVFPSSLHATIKTAVKVLSAFYEPVDSNSLSIPLSISITGGRVALRPLHTLSINLTSSRVINALANVEIRDTLSDLFSSCNVSSSFANQFFSLLESLDHTKKTPNDASSDISIVSVLGTRNGNKFSQKVSSLVTDTCHFLEVTSSDDVYISVMESIIGCFLSSVCSFLIENLVKKDQIYDDVSFQVNVIPLNYDPFYKKFVESAVSKRTVSQVLVGFVESSNLNLSAYTKFSAHLQERFEILNNLSSICPTQKPQLYRLGKNLVDLDHLSPFDLKISPFVRGRTLDIATLTLKNLVSLDHIESIKINHRHLIKQSFLTHIAETILDCDVSVVIPSSSSTIDLHKGVQLGSGNISQVMMEGKSIKMIKSSVFNQTVSQIGKSPPSTPTGSFFSLGPAALQNLSFGISVPNMTSTPVECATSYPVSNEADTDLLDSEVCSYQTPASIATFSPKSCVDRKKQKKQEVLHRRLQSYLERNPDSLLGKPLFQEGQLSESQPLPRTTSSPQSAASSSQCATSSIPEPSHRRFASLPAGCILDEAGRGLNFGSNLGSIPLSSTKIPSETVVNISKYIRKVVNVDENLTKYFAQFASQEHVDLLVKFTKFGMRNISCVDVLNLKKLNPTVIESLLSGVSKAFPDTLTPSNGLLLGVFVALRSIFSLYDDSITNSYISLFTNSACNCSRWSMNLLSEQLKTEFDIESINHGYTLTQRLPMSNKSVDEIVAVTILFTESVSILPKFRDLYSVLKEYPRFLYRWLSSLAELAFCVRQLNPETCCFFEDVLNILTLGCTALAGIFAKMKRHSVFLVDSSLLTVFTEYVLSLKSPKVMNATSSLLSSISRHFREIFWKSRVLPLLVQYLPFAGDSVQWYFSNILSIVQHLQSPFKLSTSALTVCCESGMGAALVLSLLRGSENQRFKTIRCLFALAGLQANRSHKSNLIRLVQDIMHLLRPLFVDPLFDLFSTNSEIFSTERFTKMTRLLSDAIGSNPRIVGEIVEKAENLLGLTP